MVGSRDKHRSAIEIACLFLTGIFLFSAPASAQPSQGAKMNAFAQCLAKKNIVMYGSYLCPHCDDQKKLFGDSFKYVHYVECSIMGLPQDQNACKLAQIRFTPTWILPSGERLIGVQSLKQLSDKTGCQAP
jgi:protein-disulfide isomerase